MPRFEYGKGKKKSYWDVDSLKKQLAG